MYNSESDPFFEQLKADVLGGFASAENGTCVPFEQAIANAREIIERVAVERRAAGDDPANDD